MSGYDNIKDHSFDRRTAEEQREIAKKGGIASGKKRRENAKLKTIARQMKVMDTPDNIKQALRKSGLEPGSMGEAVVLSLYLQSIKGNVRAIALLMDLLGEGTVNEIRREDQKLRREEYKARTGTAAELPDDGFLDALNDTAEQDWEGEDV